MYESRRALVLISIVVVLLGLVKSGVAFGQDIPNTQNTCADVLVVFARGSGDNPSASSTNDPYSLDFLGLEKVPGSFFRAFKAKMDNEYPKVTYKAVSVHNFPDLYSPNGYKAVGAFSATTFLNAIQAEFAWFPFGDYNKSVGDGKEETSGYIKDQISLCPDQQLVLGGYSQGAQVMGESVFMLTSAERQRVAALALFGDPKYVGSDISNSSSSLNWFDSILSIFTRPKAKPWKRGSAGLSDRGLADARIPYLPSDLENKTLSWCFNDDFVCAGGSGIFQTIVASVQNGSIPSINDYANGHNRYATFGAPQAAREVIQRLAPSIGALDEERGGVDSDGSFPQTTPTLPNSNPIEIMMMLNTSAGVDDVLGQMRLNTTEVLAPMFAYFSDVVYGIGEYSETGDPPNGRIPRVTIHQNPTKNLDSLVSKMNRQLAFGGRSGGGSDPADPHQLGIERAVMSTNWLDDSEKHVVIITNRMPISSYTYNICNSSVRIGFGITTSNQCNVNPVLETDLATKHPERCSKVYDVLTKTNCAVGLANPFHTFNVVRSPDDAIALAQARGIMVDVVVPSTIKQFFDSTTGTTYTVPMISAALKKIADSTGGVFLQYSSFTKANYTDMYWRILKHKSRVMPFAAIEDFDTAGSIDSLSPFQPKTVKTQQPILFDAGSSNVFEEYKWDFDGDGTWDETTASPNTDYVYGSAVGQVMAVVAGFNEGVEQSRSILPLSIMTGEENQSLIAPTLPAGLTAIRQGYDVVVSWQAIDSEAVLFVGDPTSGLPLISSPLSVGNITLPDFDDTITSLLVWVDDGSSSSSREQLIVQSPEPIVDEELVVRSPELVVADPEEEPIVDNPEPIVEEVVVALGPEEEDIEVVVLNEEIVIDEPILVVEDTEPPGDVIVEEEATQEEVVVVDDEPVVQSPELVVVEPEEDPIVDSPEPIVESPEPPVGDEEQTPTVQDEPVVQSPESVDEGDTKVLVESESSPNSQFLGELEVQSPESVAQSNSSGSTTSTPQTNQTVLQPAGEVTEVKAAELQGQTLQQAGGVSKDELVNDADNSEPAKSNSSWFLVVIGLLVTALIGGGVWFAIRTKD